jgi:type I protein arginine methyltransferase
MQSMRSSSKASLIGRVWYRLKSSSLFGEIQPHEIMLADRIRVDAYKAGIDRYIREGDVVVDLGTGTGILAFMASHAGAKKVYAIDHSDVLDLAEHLAEHNNLKNIEFLRVHSSDFVPGEKVDVILHEQIGNALITEDMIRNVCDLRDRVLKPGGRILPARFDAFLEPLQLKEESIVPKIWEQEIHGLSFAAAKPWLDSRADKFRHRPRRVLPEEAAHFLTEPTPAFSIDLETIRPEDTPSRIPMKKTVVRDGVMDGFCHYFRIRFDDEITIESNPLTAGNLGCREYWLGQLFRTERTELREGDELDVTWTIREATAIETWHVDWSVNSRRTH